MQCLMMESSHVSASRVYRSRFVRPRNCLAAPGRRCETFRMAYWAGMMTGFATVCFFFPFPALLLDLGGGGENISGGGGLTRQQLCRPTWPLLKRADADGNTRLGPV